MQRLSIRLAFVVTGALAVLAGSLAISLATGGVATGGWQALVHVFSDDGSQAAFAVRELRLPRALVAIGVGAGLGMAGLIIQTVMRNPLGDPGLMGVSSGAAFAVAATLVYLASDTGLLMVSGIAGGTLAAGITLMLARRSGFSPLHLTLAGMAVSIFFIAATSAVMVVNRTALQTLYFWLIGGFVNRTWVEFSYLWPWLMAGLALGVLLGRRLDILQFEDDLSRALGANSGRWRLGFLLLAVILTAAGVAAAGPIGFVGFAVPHLTRWLLGSAGENCGHGVLMPLVALNGAALTMATDAFVRSGLLNKQLPAGIFTTLAGGALLLVFLKQRRIVS